MADERPGGLAKLLFCSLIDGLPGKSQIIIGAIPTRAPVVSLWLFDFRPRDVKTARQPADTRGVPPMQENMCRYRAGIATATEKLTEMADVLVIVTKALNAGKAATTLFGDALVDLGQLDFPAARIPGRPGVDLPVPRG